jgi:hypothetical protein
MYSKSKHYNLGEPNADIIGDNNGHNIVELVWAICVKVLCLGLLYL